MIFAEFLVAVSAAVLIGTVFAALGRTGPWPSLPWALLLLVAFTWAGGVWLGPQGPLVWGVNWVPFLLVAIIGALTFAAMGPPPTPRREDPEAGSNAPAIASATVDLFFWLLVLTLLAAVALRYAAA